MQGLFGQWQVLHTTPGLYWWHGRGVGTRREFTVSWYTCHPGSEQNIAYFSLHNTSRSHLWGSPFLLSSPPFSLPQASWSFLSTASLMALLQVGAPGHSWGWCVEHEQGRCTDSLPSLPSVLYLANNLPHFSVLLKAPQKWGEKKRKGWGARTPSHLVTWILHFTWVPVLPWQPVLSNTSSPQLNWNSLEILSRIWINSIPIQHQNLSKANVYLVGKLWACQVAQ